MTTPTRKFLRGVAHWYYKRALGARLPRPGRVYTNCPELSRDKGERIMTQINTQQKARWNPDKLMDFPQWLRNDVPKIRNKPGLMAMTDRVDLAADLLEAVLVVHIGCKVNVCPTLQAAHRVLNDQPDA